MTYSNSIEKYNAWDYLFVLWYVLDASFAHSPLSMVAQLLFVFYSLNRCVKFKRFNWSYLFSLYAIFVFFCWLNISSGHALSVTTARTMLNVVVRNMIFVVFLFQYLKQANLNKVKYLFFYACVVSSFIILILNYQATGSFQMRDVEGSVNGNLQALNNAIAVGWMYCLKDGKWTARSLVFCAFLLLFCVLAGTRKAMIVLLMIVLLYTLLNSPSRLFVNSSKILLVVGIALFMLFKVDFIYNIIGNRFEGLLDFVNGKEETDASTETRSQFIELGYAYFLMEPINGYGIDCFRCIKGSFDTYSHNNYVELLFGIGLPGTVAFYLLYLTSLLKGIKNYLQKRTSYVVLGLVVILACLFADYGLVSYFDRNTYLRILLCYFFVSSFDSKKVCTRKF